ncbi:prepilin-type N-terminal cleavage/methylation domain-containing protein [Planctomycetales bacterium ZRK34]|nr:prepilin-type N-terminal cleavage/methylation domain-containing protein [Planctomycetales bacterium ZRK34]
MSTPPRHDGFTLLEVLVALVILSTVMLSLAAALSAGMRAQRAADRAVDRARPDTMLANVIRGDVEAIVPPTGLLAASLLGEQATTTGELGPTLTFVTEIGLREINYEGLDINTRGGLSVDRAGEAQRPVRSDLVEIEYALELEDTGSNFKLVRNVRRNLLTETIEDDHIQQQTLLEGVCDFMLRYYDGTSWLQAWDSGSEDNQLPQAIEFDIQRANRPRIVLLVRPTMASNAAAKEGSTQ